MTHKQMSGEEMVDVLQAAGWREVERIDPRPHDSDDYLLVLMRLERAEETRQDCFARLRSAWTSDATAAWLQGLNHQDWQGVPDELKWPAEIAEIMKFCS